MNEHETGTPPTSNIRKFIFLIVGKSGSGKTTLVNKLCQDYHYTSIESYTTRPPRYDGERGHIFVDENDFPPKDEWVGYTEYNGYRYCATQNQVEQSNFYVIDPAGVDYFMKQYHGDKTPVVIGIYASETVRRQRMKSRGDTDEAIESRIANDAKSFSNANAHIWIYNGRTSDDALDQTVTVMQCLISDAELLEALSSSEPHEYQYTSVVEMQNATMRQI